MPTKSDAPIGVSDTVKLRGSEQTMIVDSFVDPAVTAAKSADYGPGSSNPGGVTPAARPAANQTAPIVMVNCIWINAAGMPVEHAFDVRHLDVVEAAAKDEPAPKAPAPAPAPLAPPAPPPHP